MVKGYVIRSREEEEPVPPEEERGGIERLPTGISKLDEGLEGGIPVGSWVVISGEPGTGKTVLTQHAVVSALDHNYRVVIVSTELKKWEWLTQAKELGLEVDKYPIVRLKDIISYDRKENIYVTDLSKAPKDFRTVFIDIYTLSYLAKLIGISERREEDRRRRAKWYSYLDVPVLANAVDLAFRLFAENPEDRYYNLKYNVLLIVDSLSVFYLRAPALAAKIALDLSLRFKRNNVVALLTTHYAQTTGTTFGFRVEHIADGVMQLWMDSVEHYKEVRRYLIIKKMRMTQHYMRAYRVHIRKGEGMVLEPLQ
jgi:KaiC/GvpD/RAD55 family RecA-like ATPase